MTEEIEKEFIEPGQWTESQKEFIISLLKDIEEALKKRFPSVSANMIIRHYFPENGIAAKISVSYSINEDIHLGELDCRQHLDAFREYPEESKRMLASMINNHTVSVYERVMMRALSEQLTNLIQQTEKYALHDDGEMIAEGKKIIQSASMPENIVLMHPKTYEELKKRSKNGQPKA